MRFEHNTLSVAHQSLTFFSFPFISIVSLPYPYLPTARILHAESHGTPLSLTAPAASTPSPRRPLCPRLRHLLVRRPCVPSATAILPYRPRISAATAPPRPRRITLWRPLRGANHALRQPRLQRSPSSPSWPHAPGSLQRRVADELGWPGPAITRWLTP